MEAQAEPEPEPQAVHAPAAGRAAHGEQDPLRILCIDGGGIKGLVPAIIIKELQAKCFGGQPISQVFDLVCGTSTGGIIALGTCVAKLDIEQMINMYQNQAEEVFPRKRNEKGELVPVCQDKLDAIKKSVTSVQGLGALVGGDLDFFRGKVGHLTLSTLPGKYGAAAGLERIIMQYTGGFSGYFRLDEDRAAPAARTTPHVFVVSAKEVPMDSKNAECSSKLSNLMPYLLKNYPEKGKYEGTTRCHVWQAVRATSAAPSYFDAVEIDGESFVDGGVLANNPCEMAVREARRLWPDRPIGLIVSIGCSTGADRSMVAGEAPSMLEQTLGLLKAQLTDTAGTHAEMNDGWGLRTSGGYEYGGFASSADLIPGVPDGAMYLRLQPTVKLKPTEEEFPMDTSDRADLARLVTATDDFLLRKETMRKLDQLEQYMGCLPTIEPDYFLAQEQAAAQARDVARRQREVAERQMKANAETFTNAHPGMDIARGNVVRKVWLNALPFQLDKTGPRDKTAGAKSAICKNLVMTSGTHSIEFVCLVKTGIHRYGVCHPDVDPTQTDSPSRDTANGWAIYAGGKGSGTPTSWAGCVDYKGIPLAKWDGMRCWEQGDTVRLVLDDFGDNSGRWSVTVFLKQQDEHTFKRLGVATDNSNEAVLSGPLCWYVEMSECDEAVRIQNAVSKLPR